MKVGIDALSFDTSRYFLDMADLAKARGIDVAKFYDGLGQKKMAVSPPGEDIVTLAANAAEKVLQNTDLSSIEMLLFATESGIDQSKAAGIYVHQLLNLPARCRIVELKQACYGATAVLQMAMAMLRQYPDKKILLIAADIARYGFKTTGESSQGGGAMAMLLSAKPRLLEIEPECGFYTKDVMDFWRPNYCTVPFVEGRYSCDLFMRVCEEAWRQYSELSGRKLHDHSHFCYHTPVPRLVERTHSHLVKSFAQHTLTDAELMSQVGHSLIYSREVGNCYTASMYLGILSTLETLKDNLAGKLFGLYSYGSGCSGEFFAARVAADYQKMLPTDTLQNVLNARKRLTFAEYEEFYSFKSPEDGSHFDFPKHNTGNFRLLALEQHKRIYARAI